MINKDYLPTLNKAKKIESRNKKIAWAVYAVACASAWIYTIVEINRLF